MLLVIKMTVMEIVFSVYPFSIKFSITNNSSIYVAGICRNPAFPEMPGVSSIAWAFPENPSETPC